MWPRSHFGDTKHLGHTAYEIRLGASDNEAHKSIGAKHIGGFEVTEKILSVQIKTESLTRDKNA